MKYKPAKMELLGLVLIGMTSAWQMGAAKGKRELASNTNTNTPGQAFEFTLANETFDVSVTQVFPASARLSGVRTAFRDGKLQADLSSFVVSMVRRDLGDGSYHLDTTGEVHGFQRTVRAICKETPFTAQSTSWKRECRMDLQHGTTRSAFEHGTNTTHCEQLRGQLVTCTHRLVGKPKAINYSIFGFGYKRNPNQLAISGSVQSLLDLSVLYHYVGHELNATQAEAQYRRSGYAESVEKLRADWSLAESGALNRKTLKHTHSDFTGRRTRTLQ